MGGPPEEAGTSRNFGAAIRRSRPSPRLDLGRIANGGAFYRDSRATLSEDVTASTPFNE
jgi:hypothetical protein